MNLQQRENIKLHYATLADMGRFNYAMVCNGSVTYVFEVGKTDRNMHPILAQDGISHILIYYSNRGHYELETLALRTHVQAVTSLLGHNVPPAVTGLPVDFGAEVIVISPD
jgi:hypothetical protein